MIVFNSLFAASFLHMVKTIDTSWGRADLTVDIKTYQGWRPLLFNLMSHPTYSFHPSQVRVEPFISELINSPKFWKMIFLLVFTEFWTQVPWTYRRISSLDHNALQGYKWYFFQKNIEALFRISLYYCLTQTKFLDSIFIQKKILLK